MTGEHTTPVDRFRSLFSGREDAHGRMSIGADGEKRAKTERDPTPLTAWQEHLDGSGPFLGQIPIRTDGTCLFAAIDVDDKEIDHFVLADKIRELRFPLIVCRSKSGGAHLYVFFSEPVPAEQVIERLKYFSATLGLRNPDGRDVEIFPKQAKLGKNQVGNWINLPYYGGDDTERWAVIGGSKANLITFLTSAWQRRVTAEEFLGRGDPVGDDVFSDGPPCLRALHEGGLSEGQRNVTLFNMALYFRLRDDTNWTEHLRQYNIRYVDPSLPDNEIEGIIENVSKGTYTYQCDQPPLNTACKITACRKRPFGVKAFTDAKRQAHIDDELPNFGGLVHVQGDPATFLLTVDGYVVTLDIKTLLKAQLVREAIMQTDRGSWFPSLKQAEWERVLKPLYDNRTVMTAPPSATTYGIFKGHINDFLNAAQTEDDLSALHMGVAVLVDKHIYFRVVDLDSFLRRRGIRGYDPGEIFLRLREAYGDIQEKTIDGGVAVWQIEAPAHILKRLEVRDPPIPEDDGAGF